LSHVYCSECGFQNPEAANYCSRCGALLEKGEPHVETTQAFSPEEVGELAREPVEGLEGPALVVRSGENACVVSTCGSPFSSSAPQREQ